AAAEQSGRERVPEVRAPKTLADLLEGLPHGLRLVLQPDAAATPGALAPTDQVLLLTGPESGWTAQELEQIQSHGFTALRMGPRVLRAETAGPACLAVLQALWGDFR
ncbi:MAG: 16S rRNA (uracil(1498)-N(3))-methyltransferase, partial [Salinisphaera sp.]|nr:16S rRNA (uracil(1498)-N(3))-methyltransferase [Salinisphaera sp.]